MPLDRHAATRFAQVFRSAMPSTLADVDHDATTVLAQRILFGIETGLELDVESISVVLLGGWSSADTFTYGPRIGLTVRGSLLDGPGGAARTRRAQIVETRRRDRSARERRPPPRGRTLPATVYTIDPDEDDP